MKLVIQRVKNADVSVDNKIVGKKNQGFLVLLGIKNSDTKKDADYLVKKLINLRIFNDDQNKMNLSLEAVTASGKPPLQVVNINSSIDKSDFIPFIS